MDIHPEPAPDQKVVDLGDQTGSPHLYPSEPNDEGRGEHITKARES